MEYIIMRNFTVEETGDKYVSGRIEKLSKELVEKVQAVEKEKNIKLIRPVKNSGITKKKKK